MANLFCNKCNSFWMIIKIFSNSDMEYILSCPFCGASGIYDIKEIDENFINKVRGDGFGAD